MNSQLWISVFLNVLGENVHFCVTNPTYCIQVHSITPSFLPKYTTRILTQVCMEEILHPWPGPWCIEMRCWKIFVTYKLLWKVCEKYNGDSEWVFKFSYPTTTISECVFDSKVCDQFQIRRIWFKHVLIIRLDSIYVWLKCRKYILII